MRCLLLVLAACSSPPGAVPVDAPPPVHVDAPVAAVDAPVAAIDAPQTTNVDGTPTRMACTSQFGNALPAAGTFGRLDGYLVAVVAPGQTNGCNDDDSHVHLQIKMNGAIYDIAIDATDGQTHMDDVHTGTLEMPLPGPAWSEGFHSGGSINYPTLGVHSTDLPLMTKAQIVSAMQADLATVNHVSVYATTYGGGGAHLVHRNGGDKDGLLITQPLSSPAHLRLFSFTGDTF